MCARVLVADPEAAVRSAILRALEDVGLEVVETTSARRALERFRKEPFALVITDIQMEEMTGFDLLREVRIQDPDAVVVVMTGNASLETATTALRSGAYDYMIKPFDDPAMIRTVVNRAIDRYTLNSNNRALIVDLKRNAEELERLNARLTDIANRDGLTGLYNHRCFRESLEQELARCHRHQRGFSLILLDIDVFKRYNDTHGHLAGDFVLREVCRRLKARIRKEDS